MTTSAWAAARVPTSVVHLDVAGSAPSSAGRSTSGRGAWARVRGSRARPRAGSAGRWAGPDDSCPPATRTARNGAGGVGGVGAVAARTAAAQPAGSWPSRSGHASLAASRPSRRSVNDGEDGPGGASRTRRRAISSELALIAARALRTRGLVAKAPARVGAGRDHLGTRRVPCQPRHDRQAQRAGDLPCGVGPAFPHQQQPDAGHRVDPRTAR